MSLKAGDLRDRVTLQAGAHTDDGVGGRTESWTTVGTLYAQVLPTGGRERLEAGSMRGVQGWRVTLRYRSGVTVAHRLLWNGTPLDIQSVADPDGKRERLVLFCESGVHA